MAPFSLAIIGLDTSHSVEFTRILQGDAPQEQRVDGMRIASAMRFPSPFQAEAGQDDRQKQLEAWGVKVGTDFAAAVKGADGILLEVNDPALHVQYFELAAKTGLPVFIDKPLADTVENGRRILDLAEKSRCRCWSASSLRFFPEILAAHERTPAPDRAVVYGALGTAPAGSSLVWYGVHTNEMANLVMGCGAKSVYAHMDETGVTQIVQYGGTRRAIIECIKGFWSYGGHLQTAGETHAFVNTGANYTNLMRRIKPFFTEGTIPVPLETSLEILAVLEASERSLATRQEETVRL